jgi:hypothetical protein
MPNHQRNSSCSLQTCYCVENAPDSCRPIHTWLSYEGPNKTVNKKHEIFYVAHDATAIEWISTVREEAAKIAKADGSQFVSIWFQMDGGNRPYTWYRRLQDLHYAVTMRGKRFSRRDYVPIWPGPITPPKSWRKATE